MFVGYGVEAPEFGWNDYKAVDMTGKTLVMLVNDPPVTDPANASALDPKTFGGRAMTYYGRWTYKYEIGAKKKAAAVLIVHETGPAGYPFAVVQGRTGEQFTFDTPGRSMDRVAVEGWITLDQAKALFARAGQDFDRLKAQAATRAFKPVPLNQTASMTIRNTMRRLDSRNVVARLEGSDPAGRPSTSSSRRTGITSASASRSMAIASTTAPRTTPAAPRRCSRRPGRSRGCRSRRAARSCSWR